MRSSHLGFAIMLTLVAANAHAQTDNRSESDRLFEEGLVLANQGDFEHAKDKFAAAYSKFPSPNSLANLARSEQLSSHCIDAVKHYRAYVALPANPRITDADRADARKGISACRQTLGTLLITAPAGTAVDIDGQAFALTQENAIEVTPGSHQCSLNGAHGVRVRVVVVEAGKDTLVEYDPKETSNGVGAPTAPGTRVETSSRPVTGWIVPAILGAAGAISIGFGIGFGVDSGSQHSNALAQQSACSVPTSMGCTSAHNSYDAQTGSATASLITYVTGGVLIAAAVVSYFVWPRSHVRVVAGPTEHGASAFLHWSF